MEPYEGALSAYAAHERHQRSMGMAREMPRISAIKSEHVAVCKVITTGGCFFRKEGLPG